MDAVKVTDWFAPGSGGGEVCLDIGYPAPWGLLDGLLPGDGDDSWWVVLVERHEAALAVQAGSLQWRPLLSLVGAGGWVRCRLAGDRVVVEAPLQHLQATSAPPRAVAVRVDAGEAHRLWQCSGASWLDARVLLGSPRSAFATAADLLWGVRPEMLVRAPKLVGAPDQVGHLVALLDALVEAGWGSLCADGAAVARSVALGMHPPVASLDRWAAVLVEHASVVASVASRLGADPLVVAELVDVSLAPDAVEAVAAAAFS